MKTSNENVGQAAHLGECRGDRDPCGDHGSSIEDVLRVHADTRGLHATRTLYQCTEKDARGAKESSEVL